MSDNPIADTFLAFAVKRTQLSEKDILRCLDKLSDEQIWHRNGDYENSIANLLLHLEGNMRQWVLHGIAGEPDVRQRDAEFTLIPVAEAAAVRASFLATLEECRNVFRTLPPDRLLEKIDPQPGGMWGPVPILDAIAQVVGHIQLHTGQIILLTKQLLATDLDFTTPRKR